ncbi:uncharacterized protein M6B38_251800 [Iris pallida]|uniref:MULE transposase domain-containing protein n=1 Tax=Iris pallida TaxID=29817 RepID=A0AAX6IIW5_IRIPA|nr:uncharacterized protein M6B38_251800 [Iris pallida]
MLVMSTNPGSVVRIKGELEQDGKSTRFVRVFYTLKAVIKGFKEGCRPFIGLDGCFLKTEYKGQLLSAVGRDANNSFFPIAWAVVEIENKETWNWFMDQLLDALGMDGNAITWISDRQKGLLDVFHNLLPNAEHRFCVRHIYDNFKKKHPGSKLKYLLWEASETYTLIYFEKAMNKIMKVSKEAYEWLDKLPAGQWSKHGFSTNSKCELSSNNMCESWNKHILKARDKPIIFLLETIRRLLMVRFHEKRENGRS